MHPPVCHHHHHLQNKGKWRCQCLMVGTPVLLSLADPRWVHLPRNCRIQLLQSKHIFSKYFITVFLPTIFISTFPPSRKYQHPSFPKLKRTVVQHKLRHTEGGVKSHSHLSQLSILTSFHSSAQFTLGFFSDDPLKCPPVPSHSFS